MGVAHDPDERARRGLRLGVIESTFDPLPIDPAVSREWGRLAAAFEATNRGDSEAFVPADPGGPGAGPGNTRARAGRRERKLRAMPALTVTRTQTRWDVAFTNAPVNLVDPAMILELQALVDELERDPDVTVVVFTSDDEEHYLGPYDLSQAADTPSTPGPTGLVPWLDLTVRLSRLPVVSIARLRGAARGVGAEFVYAADLRFASLERTAIDQPEVSRGLVPGGGAIGRLPALAGRARALEVILGSGVLDGATAERYGVVNRALPDGELDAFVDELADRLSQVDKGTLATTKALIDATTLPENADLVAAYQAFFASAARLLAA